MSSIGFIGEGETEFFYLNSQGFKDLISNLGFEFVGARNALGRGNLEKNNGIVDSLIKDLLNIGAGLIFIITDKEAFPCISVAKSSIFAFNAKQQIIIISKAFEAWLLADTVTLNKILNIKLSYIFPENTVQMPFDEINELFNNFGIPKVRSKVKLINRFITHDFTVENAATHQNCQSAKYFIQKLESL